MMGTSCDYYFPNSLGRIVLLAFEEVMGKNGLNTVLNLASLSSLIDNYPPDNDKRAVSFETLSRIQNSVVQGYGPHGGRTGAGLEFGIARTSSIERRCPTKPKPC